MVPYFLLLGRGHAAHTAPRNTIVADHFSTKRYGTIRRLSASLTMPVNLGLLLFVGWMFDTNGSYRLAFAVLSVVSTTGSSWLLLIKRRMWIADDPAAPSPEGIGAAIVRPAE